MPASRTLSHNSPSNNRPTNQAIGPLQTVPRTTATDRRYARRNALDYGTPAEIALRTVDDMNRRNADARRNGLSVTFVARMAHPPVPSLSRPLLAMPAWLADLHPDAPSLHPRHPYTVLEFAQVGSGNHLPPPPHSHCAECKMDVFLAQQHRENFDPGCRPVVPDSESRAPQTGEVSVTFAYEGQRVPGVFISDILRFKTNIAQAGQKLIRAGAPGPMKITFHVRSLDLPLSARYH
ncbi:hypothetical protein B0H12DRAFT_1102196 [Mycena haematopus]|nr:hypothetical protein B0H12DRAFT_1102196 [Mycena haematopus]